MRLPLWLEGAVRSGPVNATSALISRRDREGQVLPAGASVVGGEQELTRLGGEAAADAGEVQVGRGRRLFDFDFALAKDGFRLDRDADGHG